MSWISDFLLTNNRFYDILLRNVLNRIDLNT